MNFGTSKALALAGGKNRSEVAVSMNIKMDLLWKK